jgi:hypothetical protein
MMKLRTVLTMGLALGCAALVSAGSPRRVAFVADDSGPVTVPAPPSGTPASAFFIESDWKGSVSAPNLGAFTWTAIGTFTVQDLADIPWNVRVHGIRFVLTFEDGSTIQGVFHTTGTLNPDSGVIDTSGTYVFTSGTGRFAKVKGAGTIAAQGTAQNAACPMSGWIEY